MEAKATSDTTNQKPATPSAVSTNGNEHEIAEEFEDEPDDYQDDDADDEFFKDDTDELRHATAADLLAKFHNRINLAPLNMSTNVAASVKQHEKKEETGR